MSVLFRLDVWYYASGAQEHILGFSPSVLSCCSDEAQTNATRKLKVYLVYKLQSIVEGNQGGN